MTGPATVSGKFTNGAGRPLSGLTVLITVADSVPSDGTAAAPATVGTATTRSDGTWTFTVPSPLPSTLQPYADDNNGALNLIATASGYASNGQALTASEFLAAGVATGAATTDASAAARASFVPVVAALYPDTASATPAPLGDPSTASSYPSQRAVSRKSDGIDGETRTWQTADGSSINSYNPDVANDTNYATVVPMDNPCSISTKVVKSTIRYTVVGEAHAYYDAYASFTYNNTLSSTIGIADSVDGTHWSLAGSVSESYSTGHSLGFSHIGPHWAHQELVPLDYDYVKVTTKCVHTGTSYSYYIRAGHYKVPAGGATDKNGKDVSSKDGSVNYHDSPKANRAVINPRHFYTDESGRSLTYGIAASVWGIGLNLTTSYNASHMERIDAGSGSLEHDIWGAKGPVGGKPGVLYSY